MVGAVKTVATVLNTHKASLEEIIAAAEVKSADLRKQRDALVTQMQNMQKQVDELNKEIVVTEGGDSVVARKVVAQIDAALMPPPGPVRNPMHPPHLPPQLAARRAAMLGGNA